MHHTTLVDDTTLSGSEYEWDDWVSNLPDDDGGDPPELDDGDWDGVSF